MGENKSKGNSEEKQNITLDAIMNSVREKVFGAYDLVVGIERGGILPAYLAAQWLELPLKLISTNDSAQRPQSDDSTLNSPWGDDARGRRILLVDDVANTGATLNRAARELQGASLTTMVISGDADISLFGPHERCIRWPWDKNNHVP